jgi:hypothetical protein
MSVDAPTPKRILELINAYQASLALKGALELGLFTELGAEAYTAAELAERLDASERGVRMLCDYLVVIGLLEKKADRYHGSPDAALYLDRNSPAYFGSVAQFLTSPVLFGAFSHLAEAVRKGGTVMPGQGSVEPNHPMWVDFARGMMPLMKPAADFVADLVTGGLAAGMSLKVLDLAAGHGLFGISIASRHGAAEVVAVDWPAVLEVARENAERAGVGGRVSALPGSAFDVDFGNGYDVVLLTNFLHHFDVPSCTALLGKVHAALNPGGQAVILELVPNEDRVTPPDQAGFALNMLATTRSGDAYTFGELDRMASAAGFAHGELLLPDGLRQSVIVVTK